jgi:hypothetical protein
MSRGRWIFTSDADLPYDLGFFQEAAWLLDRGIDLVIGNRRLASSHFRMPTRILHKVHRRVLYGLWFNRVVRWLFPIDTTDTQAGLKAMSRRTAEAFFERQTCPGFLHDLELLLTAEGCGFPIAEIPVWLHLRDEKTSVRILREVFRSLYWLTRIAWQHRRGRYAHGPAA